MKFSIPFVLAVLLAVLLLVLGGFIYQATKPTDMSDVASALPYNLTQPDQKIKLPDRLREISGLTWWDDHQLAGVQDEDGYIFIIDTISGDVVEQEKFQKDGDYEGIARVGKKLYIARSDGNLFKVKDFDEKDQKTKEYKTKLSAANDVEDLYYSKQHKKL